MLSDRAIKSAKPKEKPYKLSDGGGLYLLIHPNGSRYWRLKYRIAKKEKLMALGVYPAVSLKDARERQQEAKKLIDKQIDPLLYEKQQKINETDKSLTFEAIALEWHENRKDRVSPIYAEEILHRVKTDIFPVLGDQQITTITPPAVLGCLRIIENRGAYDMAKRTTQYINQIFRYAIITGRADRNPAADISGALKTRKVKHFAAIEIDEIPELLKAIDQNKPRLYRQTVLAIRLLMLTFVRTAELINATWNEFDFEKNEWHIPAERMKMRKPHIVPLSKQTISILEELRTMHRHPDYVLPSIVNWKKPISNCTILKALESLGYKGKMTGHGFRSLAMSTIKEQLNYRHEVVDRQLAHAPGNSVDRAYDRAKFLGERTVMMQEWADYLDKCRKQAG